MAEKKIERIAYRPATAMDSVNIVRLLKAQYDESAARFLAPFDEKHILRYITATLGNFDPERNGAAYCIVAEKDGRLLGSLALADIVLPWNPQFKVMAECWFPVVPQYLAKGVGEKLRDYAYGMLDMAGKTAFFGTNMYTSNAIDKVIADSPGVHAARTAFIRVPCVKTKVQ
jgi:GNAT superfamily N-acetyltransferase